MHECMNIKFILHLPMQHKCIKRYVKHHYHQSVKKLDIIQTVDIYSHVPCIKTVQQLNMLGLLNVKIAKWKLHCMN